MHGTRKAMLLGEWSSACPEDTTKLAPKIWQSMTEREVCFITGPLGAGKTFLIQALLRLGGVKEAVLSPSFSLIKSYALSLSGKATTCFHVDVYRLRTKEDLWNCGLSDVLDTADVVFIEWGDIFQSTLQQVITKEIRIDISGNRRLISLLEYS